MAGMDTPHPVPARVELLKQAAEARERTRALVKACRDSIERSKQLIAEHRSAMKDKKSRALAPNHRPGAPGGTATPSGQEKTR